MPLPASLAHLHGLSAGWSLIVMFQGRAAKRKPATLAAFGSVSAQVAKEMAEGALRHSQAQVSIALTGIAGPEGGSWINLLGQFGLLTQARWLIRKSRITFSWVSVLW